MSKTYTTNGYIEHGWNDDASSECGGLVLVRIDGDECTLLCAECGVELGSGELSEASPVARRAGGKARVAEEDDDEE